MNQAIAIQLKLWRPTVQLWRQRFLVLRMLRLEKDALRLGCIPKIPASKVAAVVETTLHSTPPNATHWNSRSMAKAQGLSEATAQRIWHRYGLKPHLVQSFKLSRDREFVEKFHDVVGLCLNPRDKAVVLCRHQKSQIQALERTQPMLPLRPGHGSKRARPSRRLG